MAGTTEIGLKWVETLEEALEFKRWLGERRTWLAVDTETGGFDWWRNRLRTVQFGDRHTGWCLEWDRWGGLVREALNEYDKPIAMHNCFAGDEMAVTPDGPRALRDLAAEGAATVWTTGGWKRAIAGSGGVKPVQDIMLRHTKSRSTLSKTVRATLDHRWELRDGTVTNALKVGDIIPAEVPVFGHDAEGYLHGLIFADGSRTTWQPKSGDHSFQIRLCGAKAEKRDLFPRHTYPPSSNGDPVCTVTSDRDLKALPADWETPEYRASFIAGWAAFDGTQRQADVTVISTADRHADESADWLVANGSDLGWLIVGDYRGHWPGEFTREGGNGLRRMVSLTQVTERRWWTVKEIEPLEEPEEVFCASLPEDRFTLAGGVWTCNSKFDMHFLETNGVVLKRWLIHDTRAMAHILAPHRWTALKVKAAEILGPWAKHGEDELKTAMQGGGWTWDTVPVELLWRYAAFDTVLTAQLADELYPQIAAGWLPIYELELASTQVLLDMETRGIQVDTAYLTAAMEDWRRTQHAYEHPLMQTYHIANPNSDAQVMRALEREIDWRPIVFTEKGNPQLDDDVLGGINHPIAHLVRDHRKIHKLINTYGRNILELTDSRTGRLHASINPLGARTGRMSASRPNLQNLPAGDARVRNAFITKPGYAGVKSDYDQVEMRLFAHFSGDQNMLAAIRYGDQLTAQGFTGYDVHSSNARMVWGIPWDQPVPKADRSKVKNVGFGKIFGSGVAKFSAMSGLTLAEGQHAVDAFEAAFPESRRDGFQSRVSRRLVERDRRDRDPYVLTAYGRKEPCYPSEAYKAVNYLCQGTAADVLKAKLVELSRTWVGEFLILPIHDEILSEVPDAAVYEAQQTINEVMPELTKFAVPLTTETKTFVRWGDDYGDELLPLVRS